MRITDSPELPPGQCFLTGTHVGPFVDTFVDIEDRPPIGRIYLAVTTVEDIAQSYLGMATKAAAERMAAERAEARERVVVLEAELAELHDVIAHLKRAGYQEVSA